jgi:hypothetical protein
VPFLLLGQPGEPGAEGMVSRQEGLLDQVRSFHFAKICPTAALVNSQERFKGVQSAAVHVEVVR